jgi:hypothetical protein
MQQQNMRLQHYLCGSLLHHNSLALGSIEGITLIKKTWRTLVIKKKEMGIWVEWI